MNKRVHMSGTVGVLALGAAIGVVLGIALTTAQPDVAVAVIVGGVLGALVVIFVPRRRGISGRGAGAAGEVVRRRRERQHIEAPDRALDDEQAREWLDQFLVKQQRK